MVFRELFPRICDKCGSKAVQREDETEEAISHSLAIYNEKTAPLIGFYENEGLLLTVAATSSDAVIESVKKELNVQQFPKVYQMTQQGNFKNSLS